MNIVFKTNFAYIKQKRHPNCKRFPHRQTPEINSLLPDKILTGSLLIVSNKTKTKKQKGHLVAANARTSTNSRSGRPTLPLSHRPETPPFVSPNLPIRPSESDSQRRTFLVARPPSPSPSPPTVPLVSLYAAIINRHRRRRRRSLVLEPPLTRDEPRALGSLHNDFWIRTSALFIGAETARQRGPRRRSRGRFDAASRAVRIVSLSAFLDLFRGTRAAIS